MAKLNIILQFFKGLSVKFYTKIASQKYSREARIFWKFRTFIVYRMHFNLIYQMMELLYMVNIAVSHYEPFYFHNIKVPKYKFQVDTT